MRKNPLFKTVFTHPIHWLAFGFGVGISPIAPGTLGSLVALPLILAMASFSFVLYIFIVSIVILVGIAIADWSSKSLGVHDHSGIVIDEIAGMMLTMAFVPISVLSLTIGFILFRIFDIWKPWPIRVCDAKISGGIGIMVDDLLAAIYSGVILVGVYWVFLPK